MKIRSFIKSDCGNRIYSIQFLKLEDNWKITKNTDKPSLKFWRKYFQYSHMVLFSIILTQYFWHFFLKIENFCFFLLKPKKLSYLIAGVAADSFLEHQANPENWETDENGERGGKESLTSFLNCVKDETLEDENFGKSKKNEF